MTAEKHKTILLVEDEAIIAMAEKMTLEKFGYTVIIAGSGEEAVAIVAQTPGINLILMDIDLGKGMDGTEAAAIILKDHDLPVVFLSSHMEPEIVAKTEKITSYGYVVKNSSSTVLDASIKMAFKLFEANISEKKRELALSQSNELLTKLARLVPGVIYQYRLDPDGRSTFPYASPGIYDIYEVTPEEVRDDATPVFARLHPDDYDHVVGAIQASALTLNTFYCEFRVLLPRQGLRWRGSQAHPERLADGGTLWHGIISDITERKLAEEALRASEERMRAIVEGTPHLFFYTQDAAANTIYVSPTIEQITGYKPGVWLKRRDWFVTDAAINREAKARTQAHLRGEFSDESVLLEIHHALGHEILLEIYEYPITQDNRIVGLQGVALDITERKQAQAALQDNNSRLELAMQAADMAWWEMDLADGHVAFAKRKAEMLGYPAEKFKHYQDFVALVHADDRENALAAMRGHLDGSLPRYEVDYRIMDSSGAYIWFHDIGSVGKRDANNKPLNVTGLVINISGRKQAEAEIQRQLTEKEILLKEVHHRIKNNIASIGGLLSLHMQASTSPEAVVALQDAIGRVDSMRLLYDKLLLDGDFQDASTKNYIESLATSVVSLFPDLAKMKLNLEVDDFKLDPKRLFPLGIIINELLTNIMKYAFAGKKNGIVKLALARDGNRVTLTLQDNGVGLAPGFDISALEGFGLTLVKMLSQQLKGTFSIETHKGTRCRLVFEI